MYKNIAFMLLSLVLSAETIANTDPTKPFSYQGAKGAADDKKQPLVLESVIHGKQKHTVVINGKMLQVGDYIGEHRLVAVNNDSVILRTATERLKLHVFSSVIVK